MDIVAVVQARVGSSRLPAKVLLDLGGATALQRCLDRVRRIEGVREVIVATTTKADDDLIVSLARRLGVRVWRGSENDVLARYIGAALDARADIVLRCTSDCPLLDPAMSSPVVAAFVDSQTTAEPLDYASNNLERRLPRGLDTEVVSVDALHRASRVATASEREHVTLHVYRNPATFRLRAVRPDPRDLSHHRWTLDTLDDYRFLCGVYEALGKNAATATMNEVLSVLEANKELVKINEHIEQKPTNA